MIYYEVVFGMCLVLLLVVHAALAAGRKRGDPRQARMLHLFRAGLSLSAISYLLRLIEAPNGSLSFFRFITCFSGTTLLWLGWMEHQKLRAERLCARPAPREEEDEPLPEALLTSSQALSASPLTARTHQVLLHAQYEAYRRHEARVDTDHLLLGLLQDSHSAGAHLLRVLETDPEKVHLELLGQMAPGRKFTKQTGRATGAAPRAEARPLALTDRAAQALALAAGEAHRFDKASVGTEHLLLGLVLAGKGRAAAVLFGEGLTVEGIRAEIIKAKKEKKEKELGIR